MGRTTCLCYSNACADPQIFNFPDSGQMVGPHCLLCTMWHVNRHRYLLTEVHLQTIRQYLLDHPEEALEI